MSTPDKVDYMFKGINLEPVTELIKNHDISGWFKNSEGGENLRFFQKCFAEYCDTKHAFAVSSGSAAIYVALRACGVRRGDTVMVPSYTHVGSVAPIVLAGARPLFVDVDSYGNISPDSVKVLCYNAKALIAVHMLGMPCNIDELKKVYSGLIIEDASHALGAKYKNKKCGSLGDVGCFSIGGGRTKTIGCGEGGMVTTNDVDLAEKIKNIRNHGDRATDCDYFCFNFRMSEVNALLGLLQMQRIKMLNSWQVHNAKYITALLPDFLSAPKMPDYAKPIHYIISCSYNRRVIALSRDEFLKKLHEKGWDGGVPRMNIGGAWSKLVSDVKFYSKFPKGDLKMSESLRDNQVWIDWHRFPRTQAEINTMLDHLKEAQEWV